MQSAWVNRRGASYHPEDGAARPFEPDYEIAELNALLRIVDA
jgi:hypothetical protein